MPQLCQVVSQHSAECVQEFPNQSLFFLGIGLRPIMPAERLLSNLDVKDAIFHSYRDNVGAEADISVCLERFLT